ncbi:adenosine deaminase [Microbacterium limosum]|uniref:Adenosine deaminase n=1 Tax=Microbacterium limosum TaxID=3079935 RepID=A0AAU0MG33_9MICO|nr:adenosine deaminase [Microbacterium sp. Y20]WOQ69254.1 adenosine deaminase [Microbacterium sp. Y20]
MTLSDTLPSSSTTRDLRALPKGHLHLHMEAAMRPATLVALSERLGIEPAPTNGFQGFTAFSATYRGLLAAMDHDDHLGILMDQIFEDQAEEGVAYLELGVSPRFYAERYGSLDAALAEMLDLARAASAAHGVAFGFMPTIDRTAGLDNAIEVARSAARFAGEGVVSLGLAADERGFPCADFGEPFAIARAAGLQSTPHAGELVGPQSVREALDVLRADRILHGVRSVEDPELVAELAERGIPLDVCPTSNVLLEVVAEIGEHPLTRLLDAGVRCSINADDPILFGPDILSEYELCRTSLGLSDEQLAACAWTSIETTLAPADVKATAKARIDEWLAA